MPASVLSLHNQANDAKAKNILSAKKPDSKITSETKMVQNVTPAEGKLGGQTKTPELTNPLIRHGHSKKTESPADLPSQAANLNMEESTTPGRYQYTRSSPPHKRAFIRPVHTSDLFSPADGMMDENQVCTSPKQSPLGKNLTDVFLIRIVIRKNSLHNQNFLKFAFLIFLFLPPIMPSL